MFSQHAPSPADTDPPVSHIAKPATLDRAIARGRNVLLAAQTPSGGFDCEISMGPALVAALVVTEDYLGVLQPADAEAAHCALLAEQQDDGGFLGHPHAEHSDITTTRLCAAALRVVRGDATAQRRAETFVAANAVTSQVDRVMELQFSFLSLFLVVAREIGPHALPRLPIEAALVPRIDAIVDRRIHAGNIVALLTLVAVIDSLRPQRRGMLSTAARAVARNRIVSYLESQQNPDGSWNSTVIQTLTLLVGYAAAGLPTDDARIVRALAFLDKHKRRENGRLVVRPFHSDVWCTGHALTALADSGGGDRAAIERAVGHLLAVQGQTPQPRYTQPKRGVPRVGGWPFEAGNELLPDCDDTGVALDALGVSGVKNRSVDLAVRQGTEWLEAMQNPDGGWAAYVWGMASKQPGPAYLDHLSLNLDDPRAWLAIMRDPPTELSDPAWEDITARVLSGLGACGLRANHPMVRRAIDFLEAQQCDNGAWWGRWISCYLPTTSCTLLALAAVHANMRLPFVVRALRWLESCQNEDGGWGEPVDVYFDPSKAGRGASNPCATGMVVTALVVCGEAHSEAVQRGVAYLLATQAADGSWPNQSFLHLLVPPDALYELGISAKVYPLRALGVYRRAVQS